MSIYATLGGCSYNSSQQVFEKCGSTSIALLSNQKFFAPLNLEYHKKYTSIYKYAGSNNDYVITNNHLNLEYHKKYADPLNI